MVRRYILGSVVDSEKNYVDALKRILEVPKHRVTQYTQVLLTFLARVCVRVYVCVCHDIIKLAEPSEDPKCRVCMLT